MPRQICAEQDVANMIIDGEITGDAARACLRMDGVGDYVAMCERCDEFISHEDSQCVTTNGCTDNENWCQSCCNNHAYLWEDGEYRTESEPEEEPDNAIPGYHQTDCSFPQSLLRDPTVLGVELETYQPDCDEAGEFFASLRRENPGFKYERDASLDDTHGVELVCRPYKLKEIVAKGSFWSRLVEYCKKQHATAWDAGTGYGMHVSINGARLSRGHRARIVRFFNSQREMCESLAGRLETQWAVYSVCDKIGDESRRTGKYQAAANRGDRIEVRIFRATLNWERFCRNCEFVDAVRVFCATSGFQQLNQWAFRAWLTLPENRATYPQLNAHFSPRAERKVVA